MTIPDEAVQAAPCPRCASANVYIEPDERGSGSQWVFPVHIGCNDCGINLTCNEAETVEDAVSHWNERALPFLTGVKVKALEWKQEYGNYPAWRAYMPNFEAVIDKGRARMYGEFPLRINGNMSKEKFDTIEAAKAAAQADYEARTLSAIEAAPSPRAQALEEAALLNEAKELAFTSIARMRAAHVSCLDLTMQAENLVGNIQAAERALSSQPVADGWLPIETAPKDGTVIDIWCKHVLHGEIRAPDAQFNGRGWLIGDLAEMLNPDLIPTHWRPLPASPGASV